MSEQFNTVFVPTGTTTHFVSHIPGVDPMRLTIGAKDAHGDIVVAIMCEADGTVVEWFTTDTPQETIVNMCTMSQYMILWDVADMGNASNSISPGAVASVLIAALYERALHADCFHWSDMTCSDLPEAWVNGAEPKFTSALF